MLYWKANFQIPNSGVQAAEVFAVVQEPIVDEVLTVKYYSDTQLSNLLFEKSFPASENESQYEYLLTLEDFKNFKYIK